MYAEQMTPSTAARLLLTAKHNVSRAALLGLTVAEWRALGDLPGHEFHGNQWTEGVGGAFSSMPLEGAGAKAWIKSNQKRYEADPDFKAAVDAVTLLTQGSTEPIYHASLVAAGHGELVPSHIEKDAFDQPLSSVASPIAGYKNYFKGQDVENADHVTLGKAGAALNKAIDTAPPLSQTIFRGVSVPDAINNPDFYDQYKSGKMDAPFTLPNPRHEALMKLKAGDSFDIHGVSSFTSDRFIADQFAKNEAKGQPGYLRNRRDGGNDYPSHVTFEVEKGARGLPVTALSPWKQKEVITRGKFQVVSATKTKRDRAVDLHVVLRQKHG